MKKALLLSLSCMAIMPQITRAYDEKVAILAGTVIAIGGTYLLLRQQPPAEATTINQQEQVLNLEQLKQQQEKDEQERLQAIKKQQAKDNEQRKKENEQPGRDIATTIKALIDENEAQEKEFKRKKEIEDAELADDKKWLNFTRDLIHAIR